MQNTEIGHFALVINDKEFKLIPSFRAMSNLASAERLIVIYDIIHSDRISALDKVVVAREIMLACCNDKSLDDYLVGRRRGKIHFSAKSISLNDQIVVAAALMRHGIAGVNRPKFSGSNKSKGKAASKVDINRIASDARIHFGLTRDEAYDLTMSEFYQLLASKYPPGSGGQDEADLDKHKEVMSDPKQQEMYRKAMESLNNGK